MSVTFWKTVHLDCPTAAVCGAAVIHAAASAEHLLVPGLNTGHSAVKCVYELRAPKTQLEDGIGRICLGSSFTHKHSHPADLRVGNALFRVIRQTQLGQDPNRGSHGCTSGFLDPLVICWLWNNGLQCVFARSKTNHVKVANRVENTVRKQCFDYPTAGASVMEDWLICQAELDLKIIYNSVWPHLIKWSLTDGPALLLFQGLSMRFNQPSYAQMGVGSASNSYFPFNVAALASMSNQQLEVSNELHMHVSHSFRRQLIVTCVLRHWHLASASCYLCMLVISVKISNSAGLF